MSLFLLLSPPVWILVVAGLCTLTSLLASTRLLRSHFSNWSNPQEQRPIAVIISMAPLYATVSFAGLLDVGGSTAFFSFLEALKECYESLVIAKFLSLMYSYLNISMDKDIVPDEIKGRPIHISFPLNLFVPHTLHLNPNVLRLLKWWTWQFVIIRPVLSVFMIIMQLFGLYKGIIRICVSLMLNVSVSLALYALVLFYHVFVKELSPHNPLAKFLCVKGIVFFSFWQGIALEILATLGVIRSGQMWLEVDQIEEAIQNLLICVEMVFFAFVQQYAFSSKPYSTQTNKKKNE